MGPGMENVGIVVGWFNFGVVGVGKTFNFASGYALGAGQSDKKIGIFGAK